MSPDLKLATVYVMTLGGGEAEEAVEPSRQAQALLARDLGQARQHEVHARAQVQGGHLVRGVPRIDELLASPKVARDLDD